LFNQQADFGGKVKQLYRKITTNPFKPIKAALFQTHRSIKRNEMD
jgi:hypothetical protein